MSATDERQGRCLTLQHGAIWWFQASRPPQVGGGEGGGVYKLQLLMWGISWWSVVEVGERRWWIQEEYHKSEPPKAFMGRCWRSRWTHTLLHISRTFVDVIYMCLLASGSDPAWCSLMFSCFHINPPQTLIYITYLCVRPINPSHVGGGGGGT